MFAASNERTEFEFNDHQRTNQTVLCTTYTLVRQPRLLSITVKVWYGTPQNTQLHWAVQQNMMELKSRNKPKGVCPEALQAAKTHVTGDPKTAFEKPVQQQLVCESSFMALLGLIHANSNSMEV